MSTTTTTASPFHPHHSSNNEQHLHNSRQILRHSNLTLEDALGQFSDALEAAARLGEDVIIDLLVGWTRDLRLRCARGGGDHDRGSTENETVEMEHRNGQDDMVDFQQQNWDDDNNDQLMESESQADKHNDFDLDLLDEVVQTMSRQTATVTHPTQSYERLDQQSQDGERFQLVLEKEQRVEAQLKTVSQPSTFSQGPSQTYHYPNLHEPEIPLQLPLPQSQPPSNQYSQQPNPPAALQPPNPSPPTLPRPALLIPSSSTSETYLRGLTTAQLASYGIPTSPIPATLESRPWNRWKWRSAKIALYGRLVTGIHQCYLCQKKPLGARYEGCITWVEGATGGGGARMRCANCTWRKKGCLWPDGEGRFVLPEKGKEKEKDGEEGTDETGDGVVEGEVE